MSVKKNTIWNLFGTAIPLFLGMFTIPYIVRNSGVEAFGILTLVWALIGYFSLFDFGLGRALTQKISIKISNEEEDEIPELIISGVCFTIFAGFLGGFFLFFLSHVMAFKWLGISDDLKNEAYYSFLIASIGIPFATITSGLRGVLEAYEDFKKINYLRLILGAANFGLPALCIFYSKNTLTMMVLTLVFARFIVMIAHFYFVKMRIGYRSFIDFEKIKIYRLKELLSFGAWMTVSNIISPLMVTADRFLVSALLGASMVAFYTVPSEALARVLIVPGALTGALFPRMTALINKDKAEAKKIYNQCLLILTISMVPICLSLIVFSELILNLWMGEEFSKSSWMVFSILAIGIFLNSIAYLPFVTLQAEGGAKKTALIHLSELIFYIPLFVIFINFWGIVGAALAWMLRVGVDCLLLMLATRKIWI